MSFADYQYKTQKFCPDYLPYRSLGRVNSEVIKPSTGRLYVVKCLNLNENTRYLQFFDDPESTNTSNLINVFPIYDNGSLLILGSDFFGNYGMLFLNGITWGISTSALTFTPATALDTIFYAGYL